MARARKAGPARDEMDEKGLVGWLTGAGKTPTIYPKRHALCIGINKYPHLPPERQLRYAVADAEELAALLKNDYGFQDPVILRDGKATKQGIEAAIAALSNPDRVGGADCVVIYFSGHGQTVRSAGEAEIGFLIPSDANVDMNRPELPEPYVRDCLRMDALRNTTDLCPARHVFFVVDACYSGYAASTKGLKPMSAALESALQYPVCQIITAGAKGEESLEHPSLGHGVFTYKLLEFLRAERQPVLGTKLGSRLCEVVPAEVRRLFPNATLTPQPGKLSGEGDFVFVRPDFGRAKTRPRKRRPGVSPDGAGPAPGEIDAALRKRRIRRLEVILQDYQSGDLADAAKAEIARLTETRRVKKVAKLADYTESHAGLDLEMVWIAGGTFQMGSRLSPEEVARKYGGEPEWYKREHPLHTVELDGFWLAKYSVTQRQFEALTGKKPSYFKGPDRPVESVSWEAATAFCRKLSEATGQEYTLPTEAQWEFACRAGSEGEWCFGDDASLLDEYAWYGKNSGNETHVVGEKRPNEWGLYDMHGNVWEWCRDRYGEAYYKDSPRYNPTGPETGALRVLRGGSWILVPRPSRSACRIRNYPTLAWNYVGFRVCRGAPR